jgi:hypothetical protein
MITPETVLCWRRDILRRRWIRKSQHKRPGRPAAHHNIAALVLRLAPDNPAGGTHTLQQRTPPTFVGVSYATRTARPVDPGGPSSFANEMYQLP